MRFVILLACMIVAVGVVSTQLAMFTNTISDDELGKALAFFGKKPVCKQKTTKAAKESCKNCFMYNYIKLRLNDQKAHDYAKTNAQCTDSSVSDQLVTSFKDACTKLVLDSRRDNCEKCAAAHYFKALNTKSHQKSIDDMNTALGGCVVATHCAKYTNSFLLEFKDASIAFAKKKECAQKTNQAAKETCKNCFLYDYNKRRWNNLERHSDALRDAQCINTAVSDGLIQAFGVDCAPLVTVSKKKKCWMCERAQYFKALKTMQSPQTAISEMRKTSALCVDIVKLAPYPISDNDSKAIARRFKSKCGGKKMTKKMKQSCKNCLTYDYHRRRLTSKSVHGIAMRQATCVNTKIRQTRSATLATAVMVVCTKLTSLTADPVFKKVLACTHCMYAQYFAALQSKKHGVAFTVMKDKSERCKKVVRAGLYH